MKHPPILASTLVLLCAITGPTLTAQELSLEDAFDTTGINWLSSVAWVQADENNPELEAINRWHGVEEGSYDGEDALYVKLPDTPSAYAHLSTTIQGPFEYSFWYKSEADDGGYFTGSISGDNFYHTIQFVEDGEWHQATGKIRTSTDLEFYVALNGSGEAEGWLDHFEINSIFPPDIIDFPQSAGAPLGKPIILHVEAAGSGEVSYRWFQNEIELPGENEASITIPGRNLASTEKFQVEVTDTLGSVLSPQASVQFLSLNEVLDNEELTFTFPEILSQNYSDMIILGPEASDGEDAIHLVRYDMHFDTNNYTTVNFVEAEVQGPVIVRYMARGLINATLDGASGPKEFGEYSEEWEEKHLLIADNQVHSVRWFAANFTTGRTSGEIDQISLSHEPVMVSIPTIQRALVGQDSELSYEFLSPGTTTHQLLQDGEVVLESVGSPINLKDLTLDQSGIYTVRILNEFEESVESEEMEIFIYSQDIGTALEQPDLTWHQEGFDIWIPQIYDTYDGEDAVLPEHWREPATTTGGTLSTTINGPAYLSFWWKGGSFNGNGSEIGLQANSGDWEYTGLLLTSESNHLSWRGSSLDQVRIEYLDNNPFKFWAFQEFDEEGVLNNFPDIRDGDRDYDGYSNLTEWALNKNIDFPNGAQPFELIEENGQRYLAITFSRRGDLGQYTVYLEASSDLNFWEKIDSVISETYHESNDTYTVTIRDTQPIDEGSRFIRLIVSDEDS